MEENKKPHSLNLKERTYLTITQVSDVDTFDERKIILLTDEDVIEVEGENLHIQKLDVASGDLAIEVEIFSILYSGKNYGGKQKGFFKKPFLLYQFTL